MPSASRHLTYQDVHTPNVLVQAWQPQKARRAKKHEYLSSDFLHHHSGQQSIWNRPRAETVLLISFFEGRWRPMSWRKQKNLLGKQPKLWPEQNKTMNVGRASSFSRQSSKWNRTGFPSHKKKGTLYFKKQRVRNFLQLLNLWQRIIRRYNYNSRTDGFTMDYQKHYPK